MVTMAISERKLGLVTPKIIILAAALCAVFTQTLIPIPASAQTNQTHSPPFKVGFISNGAVEANRIQALIIKELSPFIKDSRGIDFVSYTASESPGSFKQQIEKANANPDIRAIVTPGFLGSQFIYRQTSFPKPTFLSWIIDPNLIGSEVKNQTANLHWLSTKNDIETTFKTIAQVIGAKPITLVIDTSTANLGERFFAALKKNAALVGLDLSITLLDRSSPALAQIPPGVAMALVPPMLKGTDEIIQQIQEGNIPVFTFEGPRTVAKGAMMTDLVDANESLIARRIALDIYGFYQGEKLVPGPRWFDPEHHLTLNLAAAQRMGVDLPIDVISSATVVGFANRKINSITLESALRWSLDKNPSLAQSRNNIALANESVIQARAALLPQFEAEIEHTRNRSRGSTVESGNPDRNTRASLNVSQVIYSVADGANHNIAKLNRESRRYLNDADRQATVIDTLNVFLQVLISEASLAAQQENVRLARSNLSMAEKRVKLGSGTAGDAYNAEAAIAAANSDLLAARIGALEARRSLMNVTNTQFDENSAFSDVNLQHPSIAASHTFVQPLLETLNGIQRLAQWSSQKALSDSPNLRATNTTIDSGRRQLKAANKARYSPEVRLVGQAFNHIDSSTGTSGANLDNVDDASLSVKVTLPLWTSGRNSSLIRQSRKELLNSELEYLASKNTAQLTARNATYSLAQAWQDIKLGKIALTSAEKSLQINQQAYASGALTIDALQSIQNTYIAALSGDKTNLYQYIQALGNWQLQVAAVSYLMDTKTYQLWSEDFQSDNR